MLNSMIPYLLSLLISLPAILIALSLHELSHGYAAYRLGDPSAKFAGRLSLNPLRHLDPIGFLCLIFFRFGWAKPVQVDARFFKNPKRDMAITALAGPLSNFVLAFLSSFLYVAMCLPVYRYAWAMTEPYLILCYIVEALIYINLGLGVFNLIPIPPLDGSKILYSFLPNRIIFRLIPYEKYIQFVLIILLYLGFLSRPMGIAVDWISDLFLTLAKGVIL